MGEAIPELVRANARPFLINDIIVIIIIRVHIIHLALYNLLLTERGKDGFFRWNTQICKFIEVRFSWRPFIINYLLVIN